MGLSHVKAFAQDHAGDTEVAAVCARNPDNIRKALDAAPGARIYKDEADLLAADLDAVVISTPNFTHVPLALKALALGKHVFLEKPCGINREECAALVDASAGRDRVIMIGHELRYSPYFRAIHQMVQAGDIGRPRMAWTRELRGPFQKKSGDWIHDGRRSGGTLVDKNCHHFDLMNWWIGSPPARVSAFGGCAVNHTRSDEHQVIDHATVNWEHANGARGTLQLCMFAREFPDEELEMGIIGETGVLQTRIHELEILRWRRGHAEPAIHKVNCRRGQGWGGHLGFAEAHRAFIEAMQSGEKPLTTPRNCVDGTLLAIAAEESIRDGGAVVTV